MDIAAPETDAFLAEKRQLRFYVSTKARAKERWQRLAEGLTLNEAARTAHQAVDQHFEIGIFVETASGGLLYWSSKTARIFNSLALRDGYS